MKSLELLWVTIFFVLAVDFGEASLLAFGRTRPKKINERKTTEAPYVCLDSPIDLPACNFEPEVIEQFERSSRQKRTLEYLAASDLPRNLQELSSIEDPRKRYTRALTIVYKIEGCIPSRLPFDLPICQSKHINERIIEVRRLFPFKVMGDSERDSGVPFVFPEFDYNKWRTFMKGPWTRPIKEAEAVEESSFEESSASESDSDSVKESKQKKLEELKADKPKGEKLTLMGLSKKMIEDEMSSRSSRSKNRVTREGSNEMSVEKIKTKETNGSVVEEGQTEEELDEEERERVIAQFLYEQKIGLEAEEFFETRLKNGFFYPQEKAYGSFKLIGSDFPYAGPIPYDAAQRQEAKLQAEKDADEFPYDQAISYDPRKLQENRRLQMYRIIPFHTRQLKVVEVSKEDNFRDVPFDKKMLAAAKQGGAFPYPKDVPEDTSKNLETSKVARSPSPREAESVRVPVRHVLQLSSMEHSSEAEKVSRKEEKNREVQSPGDSGTIVDEKKQKGQAPRSNERSEASLLVPRVVRGAIESSTNDLSSMSDNYEIPSRWSEFPYAKAIPFDPAKLRHQRSVRHDTSILAVPHVFPYARAIPYDPWKLNSLIVNNDQSIDQTSNLNDSDSLSRD